MHIGLNRFFLILLLGSTLFRSYSQPLFKAEEVCEHPKIKTLLFYRTGWELSMPLIFTEEDETLEFRFDYLDKPEIDFNYSIVNCTYNWRINDIPEQYYIDGFNDRPLDDADPSRNTTEFFTHYKLTLPNDDIRLLKSGNYLLRIYDRNHPEKTIIARRFCIAEDLVKIASVIKEPDDEHQELNLVLDISRLNATFPLTDIKIVILKNYTWNDTIHINSAPLLRDQKLYLDMPYQIVAEGGNEYRFFDTKNTRIVSERVAAIEYRAPYYYFILEPDEIKQYSPYFKSADLNGRFFIEIPDANDRHLDSDYVDVEFTLRCDVPLGSEVFLYGALSGWSANKSNLMTYDFDEQVYQKTLRLKQGYYNYAYATRDLNSQYLQFDLTEGNHSETENDYLVFVYFRTNTDDFDRLVGYTVINSTGKKSDESVGEK